MKDKIRERERALEEEFFARRERELLEKMRSEVEHARDREALSHATGIGDPELLEQLLELGVSAENVAAFSLVPLIFMAWADHRLLKVEKHAVLEAAHDAGIYSGGAAHAILEAWLAEKPPAKLFESWEEWIELTASGLPPQERTKLRDRILGLAKEVARAAGGLLETGIPLDPEERDVLAELEAVFDRILA